MRATMDTAGGRVLHGIVGGLVAGLVFALADAFIEIAIMRVPNYVPLRLPAGVVDPSALQAGAPASRVFLEGLAAHAFFSAVYGLIFVGLLVVLRQLDAADPVLVIYGAVYSGILWVINFVVIASVLLPQVAGVGPLVAAWSVSHIFYGLALGGYVAAVTPGFGRPTEP